MGNVRLYGSTSGYTELAAPAVAPDGVLTLPAVAGTLATTADVAAAGKILQVVRATDSTTRTTTSTSFTDVTGMAVTITPQKADSSIIVVAAFSAYNASPSGSLIKISYIQLTDASNTLINPGGNHSYGANDFTMTGTVYLQHTLSLWGYATPGSTSPVTYKMRFKSASASITSAIGNGGSTGQIYAIEVAA